MATHENRYTNGSYAQSTKTWHEEDAPYKAKWVIEFLTAQHIAPKSVCDIGCGVGGVLARIGERWPDAARVGYDISKDAVSMASDYNPTVDVRLGDGTSSGEHYDVVLLMDVFEHVEDYIGFLRDIRPMGTHMVFHIPLDMTALTVLRETPLAHARASVGHLHYFSKQTAMLTLQDAGYEILATRYTAGTIELPNPTLARWLARWPRRAGFFLAPDLAARTIGGYSLLVLAKPRSVDTVSTG